MKKRIGWGEEKWILGRVPIVARATSLASDVNGDTLCTHFTQPNLKNLCDRVTEERE